MRCMRTPAELFPDTMSQSELPPPAPESDDDYLSLRMRRARALLRNVMRVNRELERELLRQINSRRASPRSPERVERAKRR